MMTAAVTEGQSTARRITSPTAVSPPVQVFRSSRFLTITRPPSFAENLFGHVGFERLRHRTLPGLGKQSVTAETATATIRTGQNPAETSIRTRSEWDQPDKDTDLQLLRALSSHPATYASFASNQ
jgi:hypothetical protein